MKISGFTFMKNTSKLYYPYIESIKSILPIVDEFIILLGDSDADDTTEIDIKRLNSDKIKIFYSVWDREKYRDTSIYAQQTQEAMSHCSGDWLFYLQSDEVVHEKYLEIIKDSCIYYKEKPEIEALLFNYKHFWGDYNHAHDSHGWYKQEIRIVKNGIKNLYSWRDAQSFRIIENFSGDFMQKKGSRKLNVAHIPAYIYHYGFVRPPITMKTKSTLGEVKNEYFDYGPMDTIPLFDGTHPTLMRDAIAKFNWQDMLYNKPKKDSKVIQKHQRYRVRLQTWLEKILFNNKKELGGFQNFNIVDEYH